ncbi:MAG: hypothetical protein HY529_00985 [Chloroflexi bacterium]|nr:hypothetical protein [Chloroflexota bacterium]
MKSENGVVSSHERRQGMAKNLTRWFFLAMAAVSVALLGSVLITPKELDSAINDVSAVIDFRNSAEDRFVFKAHVTELMTSTSVDDFKITVTIEQNGQPQQTWTGKPTVVR